MSIPSAFSSEHRRDVSSSKSGSQGHDRGQLRRLAEEQAARINQVIESLGYEESKERGYDVDNINKNNIFRYYFDYGIVYSEECEGFVHSEMEAGIAPLPQGCSVAAPISPGSQDVLRRCDEILAGWHKLLGKM